MVLFDDLRPAEPEVALPELQGSDAQVRWAKDVREKILRAMRQAIREEELLLKRAAERGVDVPAEARGRLENAACLLLGWQEETRAWKWIDAREENARSLLGLAEAGL